MEIFQEEIDEVREDLFRKIDDLVLNPTFEELAGVLNALSRKQKCLLRTLEGLIKQGLSRDDLWKLAEATYNLDPFLLNFLLWRLRGLSISETEMKHKDVSLYIDLDFACKLIVLPHCPLSVLL